MLYWFVTERIQIICFITTKDKQGTFNVKQYETKKLGENKENIQMGFYKYVSKTKINPSHTHTQVIHCKTRNCVQGSTPPGYNIVKLVSVLFWSSSSWPFPVL